MRLRADRKWKYIRSSALICVHPGVYTSLLNHHSLAFLALIQCMRQSHEIDLCNTFIPLRRYLHQYPELQFEEHNTSAYIRSKLDELGIPFKYPYAKTGISAVIGGNFAFFKAQRVLVVYSLASWPCFYFPAPFALQADSQAPS